MGKLRQKEGTPKIHGKGTDKSQGCVSDQHPWLSFRYITSNSSYSLKFLNHLSSAEKAAALTGLCLRLQELTAWPWIHWQQQPKASGLETIPYSQLNFAANFTSDSECPITKDTSLYVFRFNTHLGNAKGRIIGFKQSPCAAFHIIGYDFDFSAYQH